FSRAYGGCALLMQGAHKGLLSAGQWGFRTMSFFYLPLVYSDRKRLRFAPPISKPRPLPVMLKKSQRGTFDRLNVDNFDKLVEYKRHLNRNFA
ncbi:MAG: hypothetical protein ACOYMA_21100, partial [Bacteroidia bacterium]